MLTEKKNNIRKMASPLLIYTHIINYVNFCVQLKEIKMCAECHDGGILFTSKQNLNSNLICCLANTDIS